MQIRRAETADEETLGRIRRSSILGLAAPAISAEQAKEWATGVAADRIARAIREHDVWVAVEEGAVDWVEVDQDRVAALYVSPPLSRRGVGSDLLLQAETAIRRAGYASARLEASQNALGFYLRRGYRQSGLKLPDGSCPLTKDLVAWPNLPPAEPVAGRQP